jgi:DNA modification methylase
MNKFPNYKTVATEFLVPYARNSRTHSAQQVDKIAASIREFGFLNPIIVDGENGIIAGHGRVMAAQKLGLESLPVIEASHLTEAQRRAYVIADNRLALDAGWDNDLLKIELQDLDAEGFDLNLTGFSVDEIANFLAEPTDGLTDEDAVPDVPAVPVTVEGDVWVLGRHRLMCGDSTSIDAVDKLMAGRKADMVFTDPPYGVDYEGINNDDRAGLDGLLRGAFSSYLATSKSGAAIYVFHSDKCADIFHSVFREFFHFSSMVIWAKNSLTLSRTDYQSQHEPCLYGWMKGGSHAFYGDRKQVSVWRFDKERVEGHTTPKPVGLIERALLNSSKGGDIVTDLFGGSGSTLIACEKTARDCRMMELDPKYCDVIVKRWQDFTGQEATLESTGETFTALASKRIAA